MVAQAWNPNGLGGWSRKIASQDQPWKLNDTLSQKKNWHCSSVVEYPWVPSPVPPKKEKEGRREGERERRNGRKRKCAKGQ